ncbi:MAG: NAD(P)/FAD-dependent oxidoreductase [Mucilaginibacter polytrichastri]|nr:NAD(P)/FAD-dependent oxidoreductase [Mucilaginibacter polytrichastri]
MKETIRANQRVIIIGGGFAGLQCARRLNNVEGIDVLLIDKMSFHQFQPLFYQVATAGLDSSNISFPLRKVFHHSKNVRIRIADVLEVIPERNQVVTDIGAFYYDKLVIATGTVTNFFGNEKLQRLCFPMKSTLEALVLKNRIINNFEDALSVKGDHSCSRLMSVVIVGGGPTGVELAGALAEMRAKVLPKDYPELNLKQMHIYMIDRGEKPLSKMSAKAARDAERYLTSMGVELRMKTGVKDFDGNHVLMDNGDCIDVNTVIWTAGVTGSPPEGFNDSAVVHGNRLLVNRFNQVMSTENIYAIGDIAYMQTPDFPDGHPQLASVATEQGKVLAKNIIAWQQGKTAEEYEFHDKGTMATIGKRKAVVDLTVPKMYLNGWIAWMIWMTLHLMLILGVKNRVQIFINWIYKYFTSDQSLRLIFRRSGRIFPIGEMMARETEHATE